MTARNLDQQIEQQLEEKKKIRIQLNKQKKIVDKNIDPKNDTDFI